MNNREHRSSRRKVYELYLEYEKNKDVRIFDDSPEVVDVRADFDVIGTLVKSGNIDEKLFLIEYGPLAYRCWKYLKKHVEAERKKRNFDPIMKNFEDLAKKQTNSGQIRGMIYLKLYYIIRKMQSEVRHSNCDHLKNRIHPIQFVESII